MNKDTELLTTITVDSLDFPSEAVIHVTAHDE